MKNALNFGRRKSYDDEVGTAGLAGDGGSQERALVGSGVETELSTAENTEDEEERGEAAEDTRAQRKRWGGGRRGWK